MKIFPPGPEDGMRQNLAVLQDHKLRVDIDTASAAGAVQDRSTDRTVVSSTVPLGFVVILIAPPPDWLASVVTVLFVIANWLPALI